MNEISQFDTDSIKVILQWTYQNGVSYNVNIIPLVNTTFIDRTSVQVLICYNTAYNVSIMAILCGQNSVTTIVTLNYGKI